MASRAWTRRRPGWRRMALAAGMAGAIALPALDAALAQTLIQAPPQPPAPRREAAPRPAPGGGPAKSASPPAGSAIPPAARPAFALSAEDAAGTPPLQPGQAVAVTLRRGQQAFFRVAPEAGEAWSVVTRRLGRDTDTMLAALDDAGAVVTEDDDGGGENLASRIEIQPGDGARLVRAGTLEDTGGRFEVVLNREQALPPPDFATTAEQAAQRPPLAPGQPARVRLRRGQQAFFALPADRTDLIAVTRDLSRGADTVLALVDSSGRVLGENDDDGRGLASLLPLAGGDGPVFLRASLVGDTVGSFDVTLEREAPLPAPDYPTSVEEARARGPVAPGQRIRVELGRGRQAFFALPPGTALTLSTTDLADEADTVLALLDESGELVLEDDDGGGGLASRLRTADAGRPAAFVRASLLNGARGGFALVVADATSAPTPEGVATSLEEARRRPTPILGEAMRLRLEVDQEAYIPLPHDGRPALAMTFGLEDGTDTVLALLDESGAVLSENDDADGLASRVEVPASPRPAFLRVKLLGATAGAFNLVLVRPAP